MGVKMDRYSGRDISLLLFRKNERKEMSKQAPRMVLRSITKTMPGGHCECA